MMLNKQIFCTHMKVLQGFFNKSWDEDIEAIVLKSYYDFLSSVPEADFEKGIESAIATLKFFPTAKELKELCYGGKTDEQRAFENLSIDSNQKQLTGYDDKEECRIAMENLNLLAACMKEGIPEKEIHAWMKQGKTLRSLLIKAKNAKKIIIEPEDYQEIAKKTIETWRIEDAS